MMNWNGSGGMGGWGWSVTAIGMIVFWGLVIAASVALSRRLKHAGPARPLRADALESARQILAERYARGDIDETEYSTRLATLSGAGNP